MRIGGYYIKGVSKRFWVILVASAFLVFMLIQFWPKSTDPVTAWAGGDLALYDDEAMRNLTGADVVQEVCPNGGECINALEEPVPALQNGDNMGQPFRVRVFIPEPSTPAGPDDRTLEEERKILFSKKFDPAWQFTPSVLLGYDQLNQTNLADAAEDGSLSTENLSGFAATTFVSDGDQGLGQGGVVLGLDPEDQGLGTGIYDVDGVLWGTSNAIEKASNQAYFQTPVPVLLVMAINPVGVSEALEPASEVVDLDLGYRIGTKYQLELDRLEWPASGDQPRLCMSIRNVSNGPVESWSGLDGIKLFVGGKPQDGSRDSSLADSGSTNTLLRNQPLTGVITFGEPDQASDLFSGRVSDRPLSLTIPSLLGTGDSDSVEPGQTTIDIGRGSGMPVTQIDGLGPAAKVLPLGPPSICGER